MRANIYKAYVAAFLKNLQFFGALAVPYFLDWLRVDYTRLFLLQAWFLFWVFTLEIPTGIVADKFGRRVSVAVGCLLFGIDMVFYGLDAGYALLYVGEFFGAIGMTLMSGAEEALLYDTLVAIGEEDRARHYFSRAAAAGTLGLMVGFSVGPMVGGRLGHPELLPVPFLMSAVSALLAALAYASMKEPPRTKPSEGFLRMGIKGLQTLFAHPELRGYVLNAVTISAATFFIFWFYQPVARRSGIPLLYLGTVAAGCNLFAALLLSNSAKLERVFGVRRLLFVTAMVPAVLFAALAWIRSPWLVVPALMLMFACKFVRVPVLSVLINRHIESENRATVISSMSLVERAITFVLYPVIGRIADVKWAGAHVVEEPSGGHGLDLALYTLAVLCAVFAVTTRVSGMPTSPVRENEPRASASSTSLR